MLEKICKSWASRNGINTVESILEWILEKNKSLKVKIEKVSPFETKGWKINLDGNIENENGNFFSVCGVKYAKGTSIELEQPIIIQNEIGYLGIICKEINGLLHFLMQAKIEPGNVNKIQISPTIQATKSNFEQKHGGKKPAYLDYFIKSENYNIIVDQIQSEQSARFFKKRNRNIIIEVNEDIEVLPSHMWMTLGQIKELMKMDNLVNMDTRTVLSCIPFSLMMENNDVERYFKNKYLYRSLFNKDNVEIVNVYRKINNYKMFSNTDVNICNIKDLNNWQYSNNELVCKGLNNYKVVFCKLEIEGREVTKWYQPLFEATGKALFVLFVTIIDGKYKFLVRLKPEIGVFDKVELGPTIQNESIEIEKMPRNLIEEIYLKKIKNEKNILYKVVLSEEGGRFYQEQNDNVVILVDKKELENIPNDYILLDLKTLNLLQQANNVLNIQLRNLLSLLEV